jgi:hypothetical protein
VVLQLLPVAVSEQLYSAAFAGAAGLAVQSASTTFENNINPCFASQTCVLQNNCCF